MDLTTLIQKVLDLIAKVRAATGWADYIALVPLVIELIKEISAAFQTAPTPSGPHMMGARPSLVSASSKSIGDLCDDMSAVCATHSTASGAMMAAAGPHPFLEQILPLLLALLSKILVP